MAFAPPMDKVILGKVLIMAVTVGDRSGDMREEARSSKF
jgi:hypothetical protein